MDELKGPNIQIVLYIKEGLGFGFLKSSFFVSGSLNGYILETDPAIPSHSPIFDAELVWEADKRKFRNLRVQNVPVKIEVFSTGSQGRQDKVGYLLLSLLSAQPCPSHKLPNLKHTWHRLLGVKTEGKCCQPQLLMSLSVQDRISTPTPRFDLRMFHSNEAANPTECSTTRQPTVRSLIQFTLKEYITESKKTTSSLDLQPRLISEERLIQIGGTPNCNQHFLLSFVIGSAQNVDLLLSEGNETIEEIKDCFVSYTLFMQTITTDKVSCNIGNTSRNCAQFNQRTSLRLRSDLGTLARYYSECPYVVIKLCTGDKDLGICSLDLRKLIPTDNLGDFLDVFCNDDNALTIHERCYMLSCDELHRSKEDSRKPFIDIEMSLKYVGMNKESDFVKQNIASIKSASQILETTDKKNQELDQGEIALNFKSGSCSHIDTDVGSVMYTNKAFNNNIRPTIKDGPLQSNTEIRDLIKQMCDSFAQSQERLLAIKCRPATSDMQVQCEPAVDNTETINMVDSNHTIEENTEKKIEKSKVGVPQDGKVMIDKVISATEKEAILKKFVNELEDWKEKQEDLYRCQLKRKEEYYLDLLAKEWDKKRAELEGKLNKGIEQCRNLAAELSQATDDFRLKSFKNTEREKKLLDAKKALEQHYTAKYQELRSVSQKMEDDMHHESKLKDMRIEELEMKVQQMENQIDSLKNNLKNYEEDLQRKNSGVTKEQMASIVHEMKSLEEKLESALQSKAFFKEQWSLAVRELQLVKSRERRRLIGSSHGDSLTPIQDQEENVNSEHDDFKKMKVDSDGEAWSKTSVLDSKTQYEEILSLSDLRNISTNPVPQKMDELTRRRSKLLEEDSPDEELLKQLNSEITKMLVKPRT